MKRTFKNSIFAILIIIIFLNGQSLLGQLDERFGSKGVEGTAYLGQQGLKWYRDWQDSYLPSNYPPPGKNKIWTVGKIDYRTDGMGMDWRWIILDLLEDTDVDLLQNFLNLCMAVVDTNIIPIINDYWTKNKPLLESQLEDTLNNFTYTDKEYGIKYRAKSKYTDISFQDALPEFILTVNEDTIILNTSLTADWKTHIYIEAWVLNPNPFDWGYIWKDIGDADSKFQTTIYITGKIALMGQGRDRHLQITKITPDSRTESNIDWSLLGISFTWEGLSNQIEDLVDNEIETAMSKELNKEPITDPYYFIDFFKSLFADEIVPTQQEILDRIWDKEKNYIRRVLKEDSYEREYWSIGYEPNWFPMLKPTQYVEFFSKYYHLIKELDPDAKVMGPSLFLTEAIINHGDVAWRFIPDIFHGLLAGIEEEFKDLINSYFNMADSKTWYREFINHLPANVKIDVNDFHIFPMSADFQPLPWDNIKYLMDEMAVFMRNVSHVDEVWVSEFGNIDGNRSEAEVADICRNFCQYFKSNNAGIERWFWFLSRGHSPFYDLPFAPKPPITALLNDDFTLTQIGKAYLFEADCTPPVMIAVPTDEGKYANPGEIVFYWKEAKEYDTGITDYQLQVKSEPGNRIILNQWVGNTLSHTITCNEEKTLFASVRAKNGAGLISDWSGWSDGITIVSLDSVDSEIASGLDPDKMSDRKSLLGADSDNNQKFFPKFNSFDDQMGIESVTFEVPNSFELSQNYPNPFNSSTVINYQLPEDTHILIKIYNAQGQEIKTLVDEYKIAAYYTVQWNGRDNNNNQVAAGIYLYRILSRNYICTKKMAVLK